MEHGADNDGNESPVKAYLDLVIPGFRLCLQPLFALRNGVFFYSVASDWVATPGGYRLGATGPPIRYGPGRTLAASSVP